MKNLEAKVALVTGAAHGTGAAAIAVRLAADGTTVAISYSNSAKDVVSVEDVIRVGEKIKALVADI
jgi:NAD(P)-dependent dehydrogenase (short-subunit alcohol dehydrogenase family)